MMKAGKPMSALLLPRVLSPMEASQKSPLALAFLGDTVWDLLIRGRLLMSQAQVNALHRSAAGQANAGAQARAGALLEPHLTEAEAAVYRRGCNAKAKHAAPKNQSPVDYQQATGLEALLGYLYLSGQQQRIWELFDIACPMP